MSARMLSIALLAAAITCLHAAPRAEARKIQERLIAPCCWSESVAVHRSESAAEMRVEIERLVRAGKTEDEIIAGYVAQYGERILLEPTGLKFTWLVITPVLAVTAAVLFLIWYLRRQRGVEPVPQPAAGPLPGDDIEW
jgi:cytochrome c-type biogenesis protein CcmH